MPQESMADNVSPDEIYLLVGRLVVDNNHQLSAIEKRFQAMLEQYQQRLQELTEKNSSLESENAILQTQLNEALNDDRQGPD